MHRATSHLLRRLALLSFLVAAPTAATGCIAATDDPDADEGEGAYVDPEETDTREDGVTGGTVKQAAQSSCTTTSVKALSQQIIDEVRCMNPDAYVKLPKLDNVVYGSAVFRYLEKPARDKLVAALKANPSKTMTVNSALRTVAQQHLLYSWYQAGRCNIGLAARPGNSNHETGLALDVSEYSTWKAPLQNRGFHWLGSNDPVHFDYAGSGAVSYKGLDVKAFQRLWNRNHPGDKIATDGDWGPQTEARMNKAPAAGFAKGAQCDAAALQAPDDAPTSDQKADFEPSAGLEQPWTAEEPMLATPEIIDAALVEELELEHEREPEACGDHAH